MFNRSFSNLKRNPVAQKLLKKEAKKLLRVGTVEGYLRGSELETNALQRSDAKVSSFLQQEE